MQSRHDMKWNVNFVWATHRYAQKEGGRAAGFTFTIAVMIQSSLIIIPLPRMSAPIENRLYTLHTKQLLGRPGTMLQALWFTPCKASLARSLALLLSLSVSFSFCVPLILDVCLFQRLCPCNSRRLSPLVSRSTKRASLTGAVFFTLRCVNHHLMSRWINMLRQICQGVIMSFAKSQAVLLVMSSCLSFHSLFPFHWLVILQDVRGLCRARKLVSCRK